MRRSSSGQAKGTNGSRPDHTLSPPSSMQALRARAEEIVRENKSQSPQNPAAPSPEEAERALHELRVHQIELEMQNEELRRAQTELVEARARYFDLYDLAPVGYCTLGENELIREANLTAAALLGVGRGALVNQPITRFIFKQDQDVYYRHRTKLFGSGESQTCELRMVTKDGTVFWAQLAATIAQDDNGVPVHRVVMSDITDGRNVEEALRKTGEGLRLAIQAVKMGTWDWQIPSGELIWNDECFRMFGYDVDAVTPSYKMSVNRMHVDDRDGMEAGFRAAMTEKREFRAEFRTCWPDGTVRWLWTLGEFEYDDTGQAMRSYGVLLDITEKKEAELRIQKLNDKLQEHVTTVDAMNRELESYSHSVSHDLRTPLRFVNKIAYLLLHEADAQLSGAATDQVNMILQATNEMGHLIENLLLFSQVSREPMKKSRVNVQRLFQRVVEELHDAQNGRDITIAIQDLTPCEGDPSLLKEVAVNLLANALKFTRRREKAQITVGCSEIQAETVYFIEDNGAGFDMAASESLFVPFHRLHKPVEFEGTGIGLALVKRIIERHGGRIWANGEINKGATFYFTLGKNNGGAIHNPI